MVFFKDLAMMHARDGFVDDGEEEGGVGGGGFVGIGEGKGEKGRKRKRPLLRLILRDEDLAWKLPGVGLDWVWRDLYVHEVEEVCMFKRLRRRFFRLRGRFLRLLVRIDLISFLFFLVFLGGEGGE